MNAFDEDDEFSQSEDIILVIENSEKFQLDDINPSRYSAFQELLDSFIKTRIEMDFRDRYSFLIYGREEFEETKDFKNFSHTLLREIDGSINKIQYFNKKPNLINWANQFMKALQKAVQMCISSFKNVRNKTLRIILIENTLPSLPNKIRSKIEQITRRTAQRLEVIIDNISIIGKETKNIFDYENIFKQITELTGGSYFATKNRRELREAFESITKKKKVLLRAYLGEEEYKEAKQFLEIIASDLEKITELLSDSELKCQICFNKECRCEDLIDVYDHLRKCPSCGKTLHLCCAGRWAEQQNTKSDSIGFPNVFRCPFCFYLLKVPREYVNFESVLNQLQEKWMKRQKKKELMKKEEEMKDTAIMQYMEQVKEKKSDKEKILDWLKKNLTDKSERKLKEMADDVVNLETHDEKISFLNYLKFKENIDDDSLPI
ncbi:MAG: hypothetical protein ACOC4M_17410 [Promethearchaeia archaeon]